MKNYRFSLFVIALFALLAAAFRPVQQDNGTVIHLYNPSFEDTPRASATPAGWRTLTRGSTPDIMPGAWGVDCVPQDGKSCLALVTREDDSFEDVSQVLSSVLLKDSCYTFSIYLANAPKYVGYNLPVRLRVWGGTKAGEKDVLLAASPLVNNSEWKQFKLQFVPSKPLRSITFEAYYAPGTLFKYRGNILLDNCSAIERCDRA